MRKLKTRVEPDALYEKVRTHHKVVSKGTLIIIVLKEEDLEE